MEERKPDGRWLGRYSGAISTLILVRSFGGLVFFGLCLAGLAVLTHMFSWHGLFAFPSPTRALSGLDLLGIGIGGSALLMLMVDYVVRMLGRFARLHYALIDRATPAT